MRFSHTLTSGLLWSVTSVLATPAAVKRTDGEFENGQPIDGKGKGAPILGKFRDHMHPLRRRYRLSGAAVPNTSKTIRRH